MNPPNDSLVESVSLENLPVAVKGPWLMAGQDNRRQGWKLHLSCTPDQAVDVLRRVTPLLDGQQTPFKFAKSLTVLENINAGQFGHTQVGKFLTVYPRADDLDKLAHEMAELTREITGPSISTDFFLGGAVYARHGAINPVFERDRLGGLRKLIEGADGFQEDVYSAPPVLPGGMEWPFKFIEDPRMSPRRQGSVVSQLIQYGWRPVALIKQKSKGAIVRAVPVDVDADRKLTHKQR